MVINPEAASQPEAELKFKADKTKKYVATSSLLKFLYMCHTKQVWNFGMQKLTLKQSGTSRKEEHSLWVALHVCNKPHRHAAYDMTRSSTNCIWHPH